MKVKELTYLDFFVQIAMAIDKVQDKHAIGKRNVVPLLPCSTLAVDSQLVGKEASSDISVPSLGSSTRGDGSFGSQQRITQVDHSCS